jgi:hypothetical protein
MLTNRTNNSVCINYNGKGVNNQSKLFKVFSSKLNKLAILSTKRRKDNRF